MEPNTTSSAPSPDVRDSAVGRVVNALTGGICLGFIVANGINETTAAHGQLFMVIGGVAALVITAWTWKQ